MTSESLNTNSIMEKEADLRLPRVPTLVRFCVAIF
jgi:hypothetical protein